jgi:5-oxopent-3-ene-1,2,5-tricarboxylate decarboxylase / 2-hydroxyhepta-2,4-diene-1,7-dioate isomerase
VTIVGNIYGVVLNDRREVERLNAEFKKKPYDASPKAPVVYMKPRTSLSGDPVNHPAQSLNCAPTLAMLFAHDAVRVSLETALDYVGATALAIDVSIPQASYYRPAIAERNADGFLVLGVWQVPSWPDEIVTAIDGEPAHQWRFDTLVRSPAQLIAELSAFMALRAGDVLLAGLPGDAPKLASGQGAVVSAKGFPDLHLARSGTAK